MVAVHEETHHVRFCLLNQAVAVARYPPLRFQCAEKALCWCVVLALSTMTHALQNAVAHQFLLKLATGDILGLSEKSAREDTFLLLSPCVAFADQVGVIDQRKPCACTDESKAISQLLVDARFLNRARVVACAERAIASGELPTTVVPEVLATVFDSFLLGISVLARDGVPLKQIDDAVTQIMRVWDASCIGRPAIG